VASGAARQECLRVLCSGQWLALPAANTAQSCRGFHVPVVRLNLRSRIFFFCSAQSSFDLNPIARLRSDKFSRQRRLIGCLNSCIKDFA
jgi:hypothetical protein